MQIKVNAGDGCFDSIVRLYSGNFLPGDMVVSATADTIKTRNNEFVKQTGASNDEGNVLHMDDHGATWFAGVRGEDVNSGTAEWQNFIEGVRNYFHKKYSWLEYNSADTKIKEAEVKADTVMLRRILNKFWSWGKEAEIIPAVSPGVMQVYGAGMRLEISSDGVGEPKSVIGHVYFSRDAKGKLTPIPSNLAKEIHDSMQTFDESSDNLIPPEASERTKTIGDLLVALEKLFDRKVDAGEDFDGLEDWLYIAADIDQESLQSLTEQAHGTDGQVPLICSTADLLNVFHMKKSTRVYTVKYNGHKLLDVEFSIGSSVTITCAACDQAEPLIRNNKIEIPGREAVTLNLAEDGLGLSERDSINIAESNVLSNHLYVLGCDIGCEVVKCKSSLFFHEDKDRYYCLDCPNREVIYPIGDKLYLTQTLDFDNDTLSLIIPTDEENNRLVGTCKLCGRSFANFHGKSACNFCLGKKDPDPKKAAALYRRYSSALPLHTRFASMFTKKACYEDGEFIMFMIGKENPKRYYLDKYASAETTGLSPSPIKKTTDK